MAEKAIKITADNKNTLVTRFGIDDPEETDEIEASIGMYLVAPFGSLDDHYEIVSREVLESNFDIGETLENDFFEVVRL